MLYYQGPLLRTWINWNRQGYVHLMLWDDLRLEGYRTWISIYIKLFLWMWMWLFIMPYPRCCFGYSLLVKYASDSRNSQIYTDQPNLLNIILLQRTSKMPCVTIYDCCCWGFSVQLRIYPVVITRLALYICFDMPLRYQFDVLDIPLNGLYLYLWLYVDSCTPPVNISQ